MTQAEKKKARKKTAYKIYLFLVGAVIGSLVGETIAAAAHKNTEVAENKQYRTRGGSK